MYDEWLAGVDEACSFNLAQPLINRNKDTQLISVNFDPQVNLQYHIKSQDFVNTDKYVELCNYQNFKYQCIKKCSFSIRY